MIRVELEPSRLILNETSAVTLRFTNTASTPCTNLVFRLALPTQILLLRGQDQVDIARLNPGQTVSMTLHIRAREIGSWSLTAANFSYRDARGIPQRIADLRLPLQIEPVQTPVLDPATDLVRKAQALEASGHPDEAWRLYLEAHSYQNASGALKQAVAQFVQAGRYAEAAQRCEEWADAALKRTGGLAASDADVAAWLEQAAEHFFLARDRAGRDRCRERAAQVMQTPRFLLELEAASGAQFITGRSTRIIVKITNQGYGPAREVRLRLTGDMEEPYPEYVLTDLQKGETRDWITARVIPLRPGDMFLKLEVRYRAYHENRSGSAAIEHFLPVTNLDPTGVLGGITRSGGPVHLHIAKLLAPGATNNEISISDSVVVGRAPLVNQGPPIGGDLSRPTITDQVRHCSQCGTARPGSQSTCPKCGVASCSACGAILTEGAVFCGTCKAHV